jgi:hypothetical protein
MKVDAGELLDGVSFLLPTYKDDRVEEAEENVDVLVKWNLSTWAAGNKRKVGTAVRRYFFGDPQREKQDGPRVEKGPNSLLKVHAGTIDCCRGQDQSWRRGEKIQ